MSLVLLYFHTMSGKVWPSCHALGCPIKLDFRFSIQNFEAVELEGRTTTNIYSSSRYLHCTYLNLIRSLHWCSICRILNNITTTAPVLAAKSTFWHLMEFSNILPKSDCKYSGPRSQKNEVSKFNTITVVKIGDPSRASTFDIDKSKATTLN